MSTEVPPIVKSTAAKIATRLAGRAVTPGVLEPGLLARYTTDPQYRFAPWREYDPVTFEPVGRSAALIGVFARLCEVVIEQLNRVPEKNFLAFLSLLGAARQPPQPARVPLTFTLAPGATGDALVPGATQAAAAAAAGETSPIVFETERPLVVTAAQLASLLTIDPTQDSYADWSDRLAGPAEFTVFRGERPLEHVFYVGDALLLGVEAIADLGLDIHLAEPVPDLAEDRELEWECWDGAQWRPLQPVGDSTAGLRQTGSVQFGSVAKVAETSVASRSSRWLRALLTTPITQLATAQIGMVRDSQLPKISQIVMDVRAERTAADALAPDLGFLNTSALDVTKGFFPFGEKPKLFDTLYLASAEAFSKDTRQSGDVDLSAQVSLNVQLGSQSVRPSPYLQLVWECWTGTSWQAVGTSTAPGQPATVPAPDDSGFADGTSGFTRTGVVTFRLPDTVAKTAVNGQENFWLRVRLVQGDYGKDASYVLNDPANPAAGFTLVPATFAPPVITSLTIGYQLKAQRKPEVILTHNLLDYTDCSNAITFRPFAASSESEQPGLYFGFSLPDGRTFPNTTISLYGRSPPSRYGERTVPLSPERSVRSGGAYTTVTHTFSITNTSADRATFNIVTLGHGWTAVPATPVSVDAGDSAEFTVQVSIPRDARSGESDAGFVRVSNQDDPDWMRSAVFATGVDTLPDSAQPDVAWRYWNGTDWTKLVVADGSGKFTRSGPIEFLAPADLAPRELFGRRRYWLRADLDTGGYAVEPRLSGMLLNTTTAVQATTVVDEILGSSNGTERQAFRSRQAPVLAGQRLEVREPAMPSADDQAVLAREEGADAIDVVTPAVNRPAVWVRWHEVPDFNASGPRDRHYVIDHLSGEIGFGDGVSGRIPPIGTSNVLLTRYQSGGGSRGNCSPGAVAQLKTTVPYVDSVVNPDPADGGAEAETLDEMIERVPRTLRHRDRAVTLEDYEDLARATSAEVARSLCVPLLDLAADPLDPAPRPGAVSVIVVPRTTDAKPIPSLELLERVGDFLGARADATAAVNVVGPLYLRADVTLEIAVTADEDVEAVERAVNGQLAAFLHPLTGGSDGMGWEFGRMPHRSDVLALIESVPGVDHVRYLDIVETEDQPGVRETGRFLAFSGRHRISMTLVES